MGLTSTLISGGAKILGGLLGGGGAKAAAKAQVDSARIAADLQRELFNKQVELQRPFREAGITSMDEILNLLGLSGERGAGYGSLAQPFGMKQFEQDPGYAFRQSEGMKALERSAAARGNLLSGSTMKGIERFGQDLASQEYQNAFNRYQVERAARLNPLQSLMGAGQSSANILTGAAGQLGQGLAQTEMAAGTARASGYMGQANALGQALGGISNYFADQPLRQAQIDWLRDGGGGGSSGGYGGYGTMSYTQLPSSIGANA